jgi:N-6 DNA Methylase
MCDISAAYEHLLHPGQRQAAGAFYTPPEVAAAMVRFSLGQAAHMLAADPDPRAVLQILAVDPACGAGVFLVEAARFIAAAFAARLAGRPDGQLARVMMPEVMAECVFGMDIDPIAVDLARAALWFEMGGEQPLAFMDRNVVIVNPLSGPDAQPPKLAERLGENAAEAARCCGLGAGEGTPA